MEFGSSFGFAVYEEWGGFNECRNIIGMILKLQHGISILQGITKQFDQRSLAAKRRKQALSKATDVMLDMLKTAIKAGHSAKYVLFDTWFSNPKEKMLILIAALVLGVLLFRNSPRLEAPAETADTAVRAYVDGKPMKSYVNE